MYKKPFLVAEISSNHCGDYKLCKNLILKAKKVVLMLLRYKHTPQNV